MRNLVSSKMPISAGGTAKLNLRNVLMNPTQNLLDSMKTNNVSLIKSAINVPCVDVNIRIQSQEQMTILMSFCYLNITSKGRKDLTNLVLDKSCELNAQDIKGKTVLTHAIIQRDETMIKLLADDGDMDPNIADDEGNTPLMYACRTGNADVVKTLLTAFKKHGLSVNETNNQGISPLIEAARLGHTDVCRTLVINGQADVNQRDNNYNSAQDYLVASGRSSTPDLLLLNPTAQRKRLARQRRLATGRRSMSDLVNGSSLSHTAWVDKDKRKSIGGKEAPMSGMSTSFSLTREHMGQLNSVVFQMSRRVLMLTEQPLEEEMEDVERMSSRLSQRRRSSPLPDLHKFQESVLGNYLITSDSIMLDKPLSKMNLSPRESRNRRNGTTVPPLLSEQHSSGAHDGRVRLQPIGEQHIVVRQKAATKDKTEPGNLHSNDTRSLSRRRSSIPIDIPLNVTDTPRRERTSSVPTNSPASSPMPIPKSKVNGKQNDTKSSPSSKNQQSGRRLSDSTDSPPNVTRLLRRRSSMPQLDSLPINQSPSMSTSPGRRITHPGGVKTSPRRQPSEREITAVYRPRAVESRVSTSWEGKSSKTVPSYLFR